MQSHAGEVPGGFQGRVPGAGGEKDVRGVGLEWGTATRNAMSQLFVSSVLPEGKLSDRCWVEGGQLPAGKHVTVFSLESAHSQQECNVRGASS
jgi:hypothetical protein